VASGGPEPAGTAWAITGWAITGWARTVVGWAWRAGGAPPICCICSPIDLVSALEAVFFLLLYEMHIATAQQSAPTTTTQMIKIAEEPSSSPPSQCSSEKRLPAEAQGRVGCVPVVSFVRLQQSRPDEHD